MSNLSPDFWNEHHSPHKANFLYRENDELARQYRHLIGKMALEKGQTIFEIGCGNSVFLEYMVDKYNIVPYGIDYSDHGLDLICKRLPEYSSNFTKANLHNFEHNGKCFDVVGSFGLVEHFDNRQPIWNLSYSLLSKGGVCLCVAPNLSGINWFFAHCFTQALSWHFCVTLDQLISEAEAEGFKIVEAGYLGGYRLFATPSNKFMKFMKKLGNGFLHLIWQFGRRNARVASPFLYVLCKK